METMEDLMGQGAAVNQRAKMMQQLNRKVQQLRKMGMAPEQIDLLLRGQMGALEPDEEPAFMEAFRQFTLTKRVFNPTNNPQNIPYFRGTKPGALVNALQGGGGPGGPSAADTRQQQMQRAWEAMGGGGGGHETMEDLMR
jgi:hypothetical protein